MSQAFFRPLQDFRALSAENVRDLVDILLVSYLIYRLFIVIRGRRTWRIVGGIIIFVLALILSDLLGFRTLHWLLERATVLGPVALVLLLLPELRQALEGFARLGLWPDRIAGGGVPMGAKTIEEVVSAVAELMSAKIGAIIVFERGAPMDEIAGNGVPLDAEVTSALILSIFYEGNPLHDGAVVIRQDRVVAAACRLPLSESPRLDPTLHMRHRAAVGITEVADCMAIVVSEERGSLSIAREGSLERLRNALELREILNKELRSPVRERRNERRRKERQEIRR